MMITPPEVFSVSLAIPLEDNVSTLNYTLANLALSSYPPDKIEVILGVSTEIEGLCDVVLSFKNVFEHLKLVELKTENPNPGALKNLILENCTGEVILFIDPYVLPGKDLVAEHLRLHKIYSGALVGGYIFNYNALSIEEYELNEITKEDISLSYDYFKSNNAFKDTRASFFSYLNKEKYSDISHYPGSFRHFSGSNLSALRSDFINFGGFDENYGSPGMEDKDLAYRFLLHNRKMIFTPRAWAFNISDKKESTASYATMRRNRDYFFNKYPNREIEIFRRYNGFMDCGYRSIEKALALVPGVEEISLAEKAGAFLPESSDHRLGIGICHKSSVRFLGLTEALMPFMNERELPKHEKNLTTWSLLGISIPLKSGVMDEGILLTDTLMFLDDFVLCFLLQEMGRVCKKIYCFTGPFGNRKEHSYLKENFRKILKGINIKELVSYNLE